MRATNLGRVTLLIVVTWMGCANSQTLNNTDVPAEFPPAAYSGLQYVDSRGCVFIRAGIDGTVTWVPRVTRERRQVCGFKPTFDPGAATATVAPVPANPPVQITPDAPAQTATRVIPTQPRPLPPAARTAPTPSVAPSPAPAPLRIAPAAPVAAAPRPAVARQVQPAQNFSPDTVIVRRHVYENRQNTTGFTVPKGYRPAWTDDRLNPKRTEHTARPANVTTTAVLPQGYRSAWSDDRLNARRGAETAQGQADTNRIWTQTVPRELVPSPYSGPTVEVAPAQRQTSVGPVFGARLPPQPQPQTVARVSTRSAPVPTQAGSGDR
jgi:hypothetical protein